MQFQSQSVEIQGLLIDNILNYRIISPDSQTFQIKCDFSYYISLCLFDMSKNVTIKTVLKYPTYLGNSKLKYLKERYMSTIL